MWTAVRFPQSFQLLFAFRGRKIIRQRFCQSLLLAGPIIRGRHFISCGAKIRAHCTTNGGDTMDTSKRQQYTIGGFIVLALTFMFS